MQTTHDDTTQKGQFVEQFEELTRLFTAAQTPAPEPAPQKRKRRKKPATSDQTAEILQFPRMSTPEQAIERRIREIARELYYLHETKAGMETRRAGAQSGKIIPFKRPGGAT